MVKEQETLHMTNLISARKQIKEADVPKLVGMLQNYARQCGAGPAGYMVTATMGSNAATQEMDSIFYLPINMAIPSTKDFIFKPHLYLVNCLRVNYKGYLNGLAGAAEELTKHIVDRKLTPITGCFTVYHGDFLRLGNNDLFEVDLYISINPNFI